MKIEKRGESYRVRKKVNNKTYAVTVPYKPTQKEAMELILQKIEDDGVTGPSISFEQCASDWIRKMENSYSPATIRAYKSILKNMSHTFKSIRVSEITQDDIQIEIDLYKKGRSPKSVRNCHGFISSILATFRPSMKLSTKLPQKAPYEAICPTDDEVKAILSEAKGTKYELAYILGVHGLRRSEICALNASDLKGNELHIHRAKVQNADKSWVVKEETKNSSSNRKIYVPDVVRDLLLEQGVGFDGHPGMLNRHLHALEQKLGLQSFRFHDLRHYYASMAHSLGIPDVYIMENCGWSTDSTMKKVYRQSMKDKKTEMQTFASSYILENIGTAR